MLENLSIYSGLMMNMSTASVSTRPPSSNPVSPSSWDSPNDSYTLKTMKERFAESLVKDWNTGAISADVNKMAEAVMWPGKNTQPQVQVKTFAVDGIQAKDIIFIQRTPPVPDGPNIVLFVPEKEGSSFKSFKTLEEMNTWLKTLASDPKRLEAFSQHFAEGETPAATARVTDTLTRFKNGDINAVVGPYANEGDNIFGRLDKGASAPPAAVPGLTNLTEERISPEGRVLYSGQQPNGEKVLFQYDAYGNFLGGDKKGNFYFVKNGLNSPRPLVPLTASEFKSKIYNEAVGNVGANDIRGLYEELLTHLEHPFNGISDALQVFGVNKNTADTVERYLDNPFTALLLDLNTHNQIGKVFGVDKQTMDASLKEVGNFAQGFVPYYGQARALAALLAKAIRNEPMSDQEKRDFADALVLKPDSPARRNLPSPKRPGTPYEVPIKNGPAPEPKSQAHDTGPREEPAAESAPETPTPPAEPHANRMRPSQWDDIRDYAVTEGEQLISGAKPNARGIYQAKGENGEDRWFIRMGAGNDARHLYEIDGKFKLRDGHAQVIDPFTKKPIMTVRAGADGTWEPLQLPGGIKFPWESGSSKPQKFDPAAYDYPAEGEASTSKTTEKIDKKLKQDADSFHKKAKTQEPPAHPEIPRRAPASEVINTVYQKSSGMIVGEDHSQSAGLRFLIDNAKEFKKNNVTTLYSEGFDHSLQPDLDRFFETGEFSSALRKNLKLIDRAHSGHGQYTNRTLLETMREQGIRVKAIDVPSVEPKTQRLKNMNYYASQVIGKDQAMNPQEKWVARVGTEHVFTYDGEPPIRGISQLTGATGVSIDNALPNEKTSVIQSPDKTELYIDMETP